MGAPEFENDEKYNKEENISMNVKLNKTCYSPGEFIEGKIILKEKKCIKETNLLVTSVNIRLYEKHEYSYITYKYNYQMKRDEPQSEKEEEIKNVNEKQYNFSEFKGKDLNQEIIIPFTFQIGENAFPSLYLYNDSAFVKHYLRIDFPFIKAYKTKIIIIKNNKFFSPNGQLTLQEPFSIQKTFNKKKWMFANKGFFMATVNLPSNAFSYSQEIPINIIIDNSQLNIDMHSIEISIKNIICKNYKETHLLRSKKENVICSKKFPLQIGLKGYNINESIKLPSNLNINSIYQSLDYDDRKVSDKFNKLNLYQSCFTGLLNCYYTIKISFILNTYFSGKEKIEFRIDLYEPFEPFHSYNPIPQVMPLFQQNINIVVVNKNIIEDTSDDEETDLDENNNIPPSKQNNIVYNRNNNLQYFKDVFRKYTPSPKEQSTPEQFWQMISEYYNARFNKKINFNSIPDIIQKNGMTLPLNYCFKDLVIYSISFCRIMNNQEKKSEEEEEELNNLLLFFEIDQSFIGLIDSNAVINKIVQNFGHIHPFINYDKVIHFLNQKGIQYGGKIYEAQFLDIFKSITQKIKELKSLEDNKPSPNNYQQGPPMNYQQGPPMNYQQYPPMNYQRGPPMNYQQGPQMNYQQGPPMNYQQYPPMNYQQYPPMNYQQYPPMNYQKYPSMNYH